MAATMIDYYSNEGSAIVNVASAYAPLSPNKSGGRVRVARFSKTYASEAVGDTALAVLPKGARLFFGEFQFSASLGGTTTIAFGLMGKDGSGFIDAAGLVSDNVAALFAATALTSTAKQVLLATQALKFGYETEKELWVTATHAAAAMGTQVLEGYLLYVVD